MSTRRFPSVLRRVCSLLLLSLCLGAGLASQASAVSILVPLTGGQAEPEPTFTGAFGTAVLDIDLATGEISVEAQVFGIDVADLFDIPGRGPFHLHIENAPPIQTGPIAISFGTSADWVQVQNGITLSAIGVNTGSFTPAEVLAALRAGTTYLNLHTLDSPSGEIRGDVPSVIPEPGTALLMGLGLMGLVGGSRRIGVAA